MDGQIVLEFILDQPLFRQYQKMHSYYLHESLQETTRTESKNCMKIKPS